MSQGAWIFLSHSHNDFDKVRQLRNQLETHGHHPLMFFLKCLGDDSEIDDLVRREIQARSWFILCDSPNSRSSHWVKEERKIIAGLATHNFATVNLDDPIHEQLLSISVLIKCASVFLSYARADQQAARELEVSLRADDFGVFSNLQIALGASWQQQMVSALNTAVDRGAVLVLLSPSSVTSERHRREITMVFERAENGSRRRNIVPIFLESKSKTLEHAPFRVRETIGHLRSFDFSTGESTKNMDSLKHWLRNYDWKI